MWPGPGSPWRWWPPWVHDDHHDVDHGDADHACHYQHLPTLYLSSAPPQIRSRWNWALAEFSITIRIYFVNILANLLVGVFECQSLRFLWKKTTYGGSWWNGPCCWHLPILPQCIWRMTPWRGVSKDYFNIEKVGNLRYSCSVKGLWSWRDVFLTPFEIIWTTRLDKVLL